MIRPPLEVADIVRTYGTAFVEQHRRWLTALHLKVMRAIVACRTAALGGHIEQCDSCGQTLLHHPHLHCVVPGGGLSPDQRRWIPCGHKFFLPVKVLSVVFRGKFLDALERAFKKHKLTLAGQLTPLQSPAEFATLLRAAAHRNWVVYAKRPFAGPAQVLTYLSRYTHRIAIANSRLLAMADGRVTFRSRDYAHRHQTRRSTLEDGEGRPRYPLHARPSEFVR